MVKKVIKKTKGQFLYWNLQYLFYIMICMILCIESKGENIEKQQALDVIKGIEVNKTTEWAVSILDSAANDGDASAMNALGLMYMSGRGVQKNSTLAEKWMKCAGEHGYKEAYHNLGLMFKYAKCGVEQNFLKAYNYFSIGADSGSVTCMYDKGFMMYKGLGCKQNYEQAIRQFEMASKKDYAPALYMLGLCYRNGYGTDVNEEKAIEYLNNASVLGYKDAIEELNRIEPENYLHDTLASNIDDFIPRKMPKIEKCINDYSKLAGKYDGFLVMYDWSGSYVLGEKSISLLMYHEDKGFKGYFIISNDTIHFKAHISDDGRFMFTDGMLNMNERYNQGDKIKYLLEEASLDVWDDMIRGRLNLYSLKLKEPERPMYIELHKEGYSYEYGTTNQKQIKVYPNPFDTDFNVSIELERNTKVKAYLFDKYGLMMWKHEFGEFDAGEQILNMMPNVVPGTYVLNIAAGEQFFHTIIIKKEGE